MNTVLLTVFQKLDEECKTSNLFYEDKIIPIPKPCKDTKEKQTIILVNINHDEMQKFSIKY